MCAKKNNPGCDCCGRVLIWDMGFRRGSFEGTFTTFQFGVNIGYIFSYDNESNEWPQMFAEETDKVDFAIPPEILNANVFGQFGAPEDHFWTSHPNYDPYDDYSSLENFWTRNVYDYKLIVWVLPQADFDLDATGGGGTCTSLVPELLEQTNAGQPDHQYQGGKPAWYTDVTEGTWVGRLVIIGGYNAIGLSNFSSNVFIDSLNEDTGMSVDTDIARGAVGDKEHIVALSDLTEGVSSISNIAGAAAIEGGEAIFSLNELFRDQWCPPVPSATTRNIVAAARNTVTIDVDNVDYLKDYVVINNPIHPVKNSGAGARGSSVSQENFWGNCFTSPISNDHGTSGPGP